MAVSRLRIAVTTLTTPMPAPSSATWWNLSPFVEQAPRGREQALGVGHETDQQEARDEHERRPCLLRSASLDSHRSRPAAQAATIRPMSG